MSRNVSFWVLVGIIGLVGFLTYRVMAQFLAPVFLAVVLTIVFGPVHRYLRSKCKERRWLAAGLATAAVVMTVLIPVGLIITLAAAEVISIGSQFDIATLKQRLTSARQSLGLSMPQGEQTRRLELRLANLLTDTMDGVSKEEQTQAVAQIRRGLEQLSIALNDEGHVSNLRPVYEALDSIDATSPGEIDNDAAVQVAIQRFRLFTDELVGGPFRARIARLANPSDEQLRNFNRETWGLAQNSVLSLTTATASRLGGVAIGLVIMVVSLYFFFLEGPAMIKVFMRLSPLDDRYEQELLDEFVNVSRAVVMATLVAAVVQGLLAGVGFWLAGVHSVFLLMVLTIFLAMIPFVGATAVWLPTALWIGFYEERYVAAILLAIYGAGVVSTIDNFIKPYILHGQSKLHPLLALLSVLGGVQALGPIGVIVGPMAVVFLQTLLKILHREMIAIRQKSTGDENAEAAEPSADEPSTGSEPA